MPLHGVCGYPVHSLCALDEWNQRALLGAEPGTGNHPKLEMRTTYGLNRLSEEGLTLEM